MDSTLDDHLIIIYIVLRDVYNSWRRSANLDSIVCTATKFIDINIYLYTYIYNVAYVFSTTFFEI